MIRPRHALHRLFAAALVATTAILHSGCQDGPNAKKEETVEFDSTPVGATVSVDGAGIGVTPTNAELAKGQETRITLAKAGFATAEVYVHPVDGTLTPNPVTVKLRPDLLPDTRGSDPQAEFDRSLTILKESIAMGRIAAVDQAYIEAQLREFYLGPTPKAK